MTALLWRQLQMEGRKAPSQTLNPMGCVVYVAQIDQTEKPRGAFIEYQVVVHKNTRN